MCLGVALVYLGVAWGGHVPPKWYRDPSGPENMCKIVKDKNGPIQGHLEKPELWKPSKVPFSFLFLVEDPSASTIKV